MHRAQGAIDAAIETAGERLEAARGVRAAGTAAAELEHVLTATTRAVQEARSALGQDDYLTARDALAGVSERLRAAIDALDAALATRRRR